MTTSAHIATPTDTDLAAHLRDHANRYTLGRLSFDQVLGDLFDLHDLATDLGLHDVAAALTEPVDSVAGAAALVRRTADAPA